jgi:hypothetical protein
MTEISTGLPMYSFWLVLGEGGVQLSASSILSEGWAIIWAGRPWKTPY